MVTVIVDLISLAAIDNDELIVSTALIDPGLGDWSGINILYTKQPTTKVPSRGVQSNSKGGAGETEGIGANIDKNEVFFVKSLTKCPKRVMKRTVK